MAESARVNSEITSYMSLNCNDFIVYGEFTLFWELVYNPIFYGITCSSSSDLVVLATCFYQYP